MAALTQESKAEIAALVADFGYLDEVQESLLNLFIDAAVEKLAGAGVPVQENNAEYREAVMNLAAYRYIKRTSLATSTGSNEEDKGYTSMVRDYVYRLRYPEVIGDAP